MECIHQRETAVNDELDWLIMITKMSVCLAGILVSVQYMAMALSMDLYIGPCSITVSGRVQSKQVACTGTPASERASVRS